MRYYAICATQFINAAENAAIEWDTSGDGEGTFQQGEALSDDGGASITHRACNTLTAPIDTSRVLEAFTNTPLFSLYRVDDDLGSGLVERYDGQDWNEVGRGDLVDLALQDAGLERYQTDTL